MRTHNAKTEGRGGGGRTPWHALCVLGDPAMPPIELRAAISFVMSPPSARQAASKAGTNVDGDKLSDWTRKSLPAAHAYRQALRSTARQFEQNTPGGICEPLRRGLATTVKELAAVLINPGRAFGIRPEFEKAGPRFVGAAGATSSGSQVFRSRFHHPRWEYTCPMEPRRRTINLPTHLSDPVRTSGPFLSGALAGPSATPAPILSACPHTHTHTPKERLAALREEEEHGARGAPWGSQVWIKCRQHLTTFDQHQ